MIFLMELCKLPKIVTYESSSVLIYVFDLLAETSSLELERLCILYNMAALQSVLGAECRAADTDEELKNAAKLYQVFVIA